MTKHTPAPWVLKAPTARNNCFQILPKDGNITIAEVYCAGRTVDNQDANAALIAAAPELLKALKAVFDAVEKHGKVDNVVMCKVDAAIEKAGGK
jgi:hypothetical protein